MNNKLKGYRVLAQAAFTLTCLFGATTSSCAQDGAKLASEKWRPKDGVYASPGKDFVASCEESAWRASYCPDEQQRIYRGEALQPWHPRDSIYARPGDNFDERFLKSGDTVIDLVGKSISSNADSCEVYTYNDAMLIDPVIDIVCNETRSTKGVVTRDIDSRSIYGPPGFDVLRLKRVDDKTVLLQKTHNGQFSEPSHQVSYCSDEAQRQYVEQRKAAK